MGKTSSAVKQRYNEKAYDQVKITVPKGRRADIQKWVQDRGGTVNGFVNEAFRVSMGMTEEEWKQPQADPLEE